MILPSPTTPVAAPAKPVHFFEKVFRTRPNPGVADHGLSVPFEQRIWRYDPADGNFLMVDCDYEKGDDGVVTNTGTVKTKGDPFHGSPQFTFDQVKAAMVAAASSGKFLKDVVAEMFAEEFAPKFAARVRSQGPNLKIRLSQSADAVGA
jgi:hypothetical protein